VAARDGPARCSFFSP